MAAHWVKPLSSCLELKVVYYNIKIKRRLLKQRFCYLFEFRLFVKLIKNTSSFPMSFLRTNCSASCSSDRNSGHFFYT